MGKDQKIENRYVALLNKLFFDRYKNDYKPFSFDRNELVDAAKVLNMTLPKNLGDVIYAFRYRIGSPQIKALEPPGREWTLIGAGRSRYEFRLVTLFRLIPDTKRVPTKILDSTPEIIERYAQSDEQALLAKVRYNRLIDCFLGVSAYSLQSHLRTTVDIVGQIEIDEVYVAFDKFGAHYIIPVQAKRGKDKSSVVQTSQDLNWCQARYPNVIAIPVAVQFCDDNRIAMFALRKDENDDIEIAKEEHYLLVKTRDLSEVVVNQYNKKALEAMRR